MSLARLQRSGSPTNSGTIWVSLDITGSPAAVRIALTRAARSWWRSRSQFEVLRSEGFGVADEQRHDMGVARHHGQSRRGQDRLDAGGAILVALTFPIRGL